MGDKRKKKHDDPLDDLLRTFEEEEINIYDTPKNEKDAHSDIDSSEETRKSRVEQFSLNITDDTPRYSGEIYFSNPPKTNVRESVGSSSENAGKSTDSIKDASQKPPKSKGVFSSRVNREKPLSDKPIGFKNISFKPNWVIPTAKSLVIVLVTITVLSVLIITYLITAINDILGISRDNILKEVEVDGQNTKYKVIDVLDDAGLITNSSFCKLFALVFGIDSDGYTSGVYTLSPDMGLEKMLAKIRLPSTTTQTVKLTFPEGWSIEQIADKLEKYEVCSKTAFLQTIQKIDFSENYEFLKGIDNRDKRHRVLEGFMFPDTYEFYVGESPSSVVKRFLDNFKSKWTAEYQKKAKELGYTADQIVILASIIEREAFSKEQMPSISSVLHNRLNNPGVYPTLQCDASTSYLQDFVKPNCTASEYITYVQNYDTYLCYRFPAGAIANPGINALKAALYPEKTNYNYFQHDKNGTIYYAVTASQHRTNTEKVWRVNNS